MDEEFCDYCGRECDGAHGSRSEKLESRKLTDLCKGRFYRLAKYFEGVTEADLDLLTDDDFINAATSTDKLFMRLFLDEKEIFGRREPVVNRDFPIIYDLSPEGVWPKIKDVYDEKTKVLNFDSKIAKASWVCIPKIPDEYRGLEIKNISLKNNNIYDNRLGNLVGFLRDFAAEFKPMIIDISCNQIGSIGFRHTPKKEVLQFVLEILDLIPEGGILNITWNPLCCMDLKDFFIDLYKNRLSDALKLVWIPPSIINTTTWKSFIPEEGSTELMKKIREVHSRIKNDLVLE